MSVVNSLVLGQLVVIADLRDFIKDVDELIFCIAIGILDGHAILLPLQICFTASLEIFDYSDGSFGELSSNVVMGRFVGVDVMDMLPVHAAFTLAVELSNAVYILAGDQTSGSGLLAWALLLGLWQRLGGI